MSANISPLAQTFKVSESFPQGCAITSVDLFFAVKGDQDPVEVQIVETSNGYPTDRVFGNAKVVIYPADINANPSGLTPTNFKFQSLVHLMPNTEYALKVLTNGLKYKLWTAVMGETRIDNPSILITQQPALGSLFKSQNNSTWTPEQIQDLAFVLNRAKFNTGVIGNVSLVEAPIAEMLVLPPNPFKITAGQTSVKVHHQNHGLTANMYVVFMDSVATQFNTANGFAISKVIDSDHYTIATTVAQTTTDFVGGGDVKAEKSVRFDTIRVFGPMEGRDSGIKITARLSSDVSVDSVDTDVTTSQYLKLGANKFVHSSANRTTKLAGASSITIKAALSSVDDSVSPSLELNRIVVQLIGNKINTPSVADVNYATDGDNIVVGVANVSFTAATSKITIPSTTDYSKIKEGAWIMVSDAGGANDTKKGYISDIDPVANTITIVGDSLVDAATRSATIIQYTSFISETANSGTAESKHITKQVNLDKSCSGFRVIVQLNVPASAEINMYYRTALKTSATKLSDVAWNKSLITYKKSATDSEFIEYEYNITDIAIFNEFQFKFVFLGTDTAATPKIKALRIVAHA